MKGLPALPILPFKTPTSHVIETIKPLVAGHYGCVEAVVFGTLEVQVETLVKGLLALEDSAKPRIGNYEYS